jgi:hypothetical protein
MDQQELFMSNVANTFTTFISNRHGKYYASLVAANRPCEVVCFGILGPFNTERGADKWAIKMMKQVDKVMANGGAVAIPDASSVPIDVRHYITTTITDTIRKHGIEALEGNVVFGRALQ